MKTLKIGQLWANIIKAILAASGILIDKITPLRCVVILLIFLNIGLTYYFNSYITLNFSIGFFILLFVLRYGVLFGSFGNKGIAPIMITRYGETKAYAYYEAFTAFMFFYRSTSINFLILQTAGSLNVFNVHYHSCIVLAWVMIIGASVVNIWATIIIGVDVYYYKDMFVGRAIGNFEVKGPFRYFSNPMYGIGQLSGYGLALLSGSLWGLLAAVLNQLTMYIFYFSCEKPHIERLFGKISLEHSIEVK
jgi:Phospholipid methyltransferase